MEFRTFRAYATRTFFLLLFPALLTGGLAHVGAAFEVYAVLISAMTLLHVVAALVPAEMMTDQLIKDSSANLDRVKTL